MLTLIAAVILAISGSYGQRIFDLVMGLNRWCYRVLAHVALMRDACAPSRLDTSGTDRPPLPPQPSARAAMARAAARDQQARAAVPVPAHFQETL